MSKVLAGLHIADVSGNGSLHFENVIFLQLALPNQLCHLSQCIFCSNTHNELLEGNILDVVDVIEMQKPEIWETFVLAVTLPSDRLRVWKF